MYPEYKYSKKLLPLPQRFTNKSDDSKVFRADLHKKATLGHTGPCAQRFHGSKPCSCHFEILNYF